MKLKLVDINMDWEGSLEIINLRKFIVDNLLEKGEIVRWSIVDIQDSKDSNNKKLRINAVLTESTKT